MPLLKALLQDILEETKELTTDSVFRSLARHKEWNCYYVMYKILLNWVCSV
jgi:hypothetical protein